MRRSIPCLAVLVVPLFVVPPLSAQQGGGAQASEPPSGWATGGSLGYTAGADAGAAVVAVHATRLSPRRVGADFWLGTLSRWAIFWARAGAAFAIPISGDAFLPFAIPISGDAFLLPSGGATLVAGPSSGGGGSEGVLFGANLGAALHAPLSDAVSIRAAITWHRFGSGSLGVAEIGLLGFR